VEAVEIRVGLVGDIDSDAVTGLKSLAHNWMGG
jgi:hypothetical protein